MVSTESACGGDGSFGKKCWVAFDSNASHSGGGHALVHVVPYPLLHFSDYGRALSDRLLQCVRVMLEGFGSGTREVPVSNRLSPGEEGQMPTGLPAA